MTALGARVRAFLAFWYDFVVGDDWRVAVGVAVMLGLIYLVSRTSAAAWWIAPVAVTLLLGWSLARATRRS
jgi:hypothetical protein